MQVDRTILAEGAASGDPRVVLCRMADLASWDLPHMAAPHWRLYLPLTAGGELRWQGSRWDLAPGRWLLIAPGTDCAASCSRGFIKTYAHFIWSLTGQRAVPGIHSGGLPGPARADLRALWRNPQPRRLGLLVQSQFRLAAARLPDAAFVPEPAGRSPAVSRALALLHANPARTPGNAVLGAAVGLHPGSLVRRFTHEVGHSPQREGMRFRLEHAAVLLAESDDPIDAVAIACGFGDRYHFTRAFSAHWHQPPAAFRRRSRGG